MGAKVSQGRACVCARAACDFFFLNIFCMPVKYVRVCICLYMCVSEVSQRKVCVMSSPDRLCCGPSSGCCQVVVVS